jgi:hypothetical protein
MLGSKQARRRSAAHSKNQEESLIKSLGAAPTQCAKQANTTKNTNTPRMKHGKNRQNRKGKTTKQNRIKTKLEQKVARTWTDPEDKTVGHATRWIRRRMGDRTETNRSTTKPEETQQRLVTVEKGGTMERGKGGCIGLVEKR